MSTKKQVSDLKPFYYIFSKERVFVEDALARLRGTFNEESPNAEIVELVLSASEIPRLEDVLETVSFFGEKRLVIGHHADKAGKAVQKRVAALVARSQGENVLVLVGEKELEDKDLTKAIQDRGMIYAFASPKYNELPAKIAERVAELIPGIPQIAARRVANLLIERVGRDVTKAFHEAEKVAGYLQNASPQTITDMSDSELNRLIAPLEERNIFQFLDAVSERDVKSSWNTMAVLVRHGESYGTILYSLVNHFRSLMKIKMYAEVSDTAQEVREKVEAGKRMHDFRYKKLAGAADNFSLGELKRIYDRMLTTEALHKTGEADEKFGMEELVYEICTGFAKAQK